MNFIEEVLSTKISIAKVYLFYLFLFICLFFFFFEMMAVVTFMQKAIEKVSLIFLQLPSPVNFLSFHFVKG